MVSERLIVYVDGFNLYHGLHQETGCRHLWLDLVELARRLRPRSDLVAVRYFTAPVLDDPGALSRQQTYLNALREHHGSLVEIVQGRYQSKNKRCRKCGARWQEREEKETDVNIAVSLVRDAALGRMDAALLVSADSDLAPAIRVARDLRPSLFITAAFAPNRNSAELKTLMPSSFHLGMAKIRSSLLPDHVVAGDGKQFDRPSKWQ